MKPKRQTEGTVPEEAGEEGRKAKEAEARTQRTAGQDDHGRRGRQRRTNDDQTTAEPPRRPKAAAPAPPRAGSAPAPRPEGATDGGGTLSGRYETGDRLGSGGMSNVYKATDRILERTVAVKMLAEHLSDDERFVARFRREALAVAKLIHPNIVQVYDTGVDDGRHYIVMEYVAGPLRRADPAAAGAGRRRDAAEIGIQACAGLDYAHRRGIIHRDVKPGNLMIVGGPVGGGEMTVKLTDFGIARAIEQTRITQVGSVVGTAAYLAPEQVRGEEATPATDVYALGVVLYQFLTGRLPYEGSTLAELAVRQQNEKPLPPSTYNDGGAGDAGRRGAAGPGGRPQPPLRQRRRAGQRAAAGARGRGRDRCRMRRRRTPRPGCSAGRPATRRLDRTTAQTEYRPAPPRRPGARPRRAAAAAAPRPERRPRPPRKTRCASRALPASSSPSSLWCWSRRRWPPRVIITTDKAAGVKVTQGGRQHGRKGGRRSEGTGPQEHRIGG